MTYFISEEHLLHKYICEYEFYKNKECYFVLMVQYVVIFFIIIHHLAYVFFKISTLSAYTLFFCE